MKRKDFACVVEKLYMQDFSNRSTEAGLIPTGQSRSASVRRACKCLPVINDVYLGAGIERKAGRQASYRVAARRRIRHRKWKDTGTQARMARRLSVYSWQLIISRVESPFATLYEHPAAGHKIKEQTGRCPRRS